MTVNIIVPADYFTVWYAKKHSKHNHTTFRLIQVTAEDNQGDFKFKKTYAVSQTAYAGAVGNLNVWEIACDIN